MNATGDPRTTQVRTPEPPSSDAMTALRESEARYHALFDSMDEAYAVVELLRGDNGAWGDFRFLEVNPAFLVHTGMPWPVGLTATELLGTPNPRWVELYGRVLDSGEPLRIEETELTLGRVFDLNVFRLGDPARHHVAVLFTDITARRRIEDALRVSEARLAAVFESLPVGVGVIDRQGHAILSNQALDFWLPSGRMPSLDPERAPRWHAWYADGRPMPPHDFPGARSLRGESTVPGLEMLYTTDDGRALWTQVACVPVRDANGDVTGTVTMIGDVDAQKRTAERLRESDARYRTIVDNVLDYAICLLDADGVVTGWTPGAGRVTGYDAAEVVGRHVSMFFTPDDSVAGTPERAIADAARDGRAEHEAWRIRKDGTRFWANEIITAVHHADGSLGGFTIISRDLTGRRAAEELAEAARAQAERDVLRRRLGQAEEDERRRLSRELHDEVGQHLTALGLGLQALSDIAPPGSEVDRRAAALRVLASELGRSLHAVAVRLRPKALDDFGLEAAIGAYADEWARQTGIGVDVHTRIDAERLPGTVESALYRIMQEALTNVARHSGAARAGIVVERRDGHVHLIVEDDGRGFDAGIGGVEQGRASRGLGLLGMRERVALLGGTLEVESTPRGGTTIFVRIPIDGPDDVRHDTHAGSDGPSRSDAGNG